MRPMIPWFLRWPWSAPRKPIPVDAVPSESLREAVAGRADLFATLRLVDGLLTQGDVKAAHSQVRVALTKHGKPRGRLP